MTTMLSNLLGDLRYAARALGRAPGFAAAAVLTLALGIGVNVAMFSLFEQILLRPLPVAEPERLVNLSSPGPKLDPIGLGGVVPSVSSAVDSSFSYPMFRDLERVQEPFTGIAAHQVVAGASLSAGGLPSQDAVLFVSGSYFPLLGIRPTLGRLLDPQDDRVDGQAESVVLSHAYWQREFGGDPEAIGRRLTLNSVPLTIVGVAPPGFSGTTVGARPSVFVPITFSGPFVQFPIPTHDSRGIHWVNLFARLKPGISREAAAAAIDPPYRAILNEIELPLWETNTGAEVLEAFSARSIVLEPGGHGQSVAFGTARDRLRVLLAVSSVVLLLCCANVAGLLLVRGSTRSGEMAVRASMGATRGRLASLLLAESLLLALPAALASLPIASLTLGAIASRAPSLRVDSFITIEPGAMFDVSLSLVAALVAIGAAVTCAVIAGLGPLRKLARTDPARALQAYGARQTSGKTVTHFRSSLATVQIGLSMALLAMTGIFAQSLANTGRVDLGLDVDSVVTFSVSPQTSGYSPEAAAALFDRLNDELSAIPGVASVATSQTPLLTGAEFTMLIRRIEGIDVEETVSMNGVGRGFFRTLGIELFAGRDFADADAGGPFSVAIVNRRFAERFGLDGDGIGSELGFTTRDDVVEIIGLVADAKYGNVTSEIGPQLFLFSPRWPNFYVRGALPPDSLATAVRETVARIDPGLPVNDLHPMAEQVRENLATERFVAGASTWFAVVATLLAGLGLYGVLAYAVAQQSREIALRIALGATAERIRGNVLRKVATMTIAGIALGVAAAFLLGRAAESLLFGVEAGDPLALVGAAAILTLVTFAAAYLPARRAARVDPMVALRYE
jgi:predicted permease